MEQTGYAKSEQGELNPENKMFSALSPIPLQKLGTLGSQHLQPNFESLTPQKTNEVSLIKLKQEAAELPEKYRILSEFFDRLICSIRLLSLRKRLPTFLNISVQVERLTGRTFVYRHLAQMKYILPEALKIEKVLVHDDKSLCMKPDLKILLVTDIIESGPEKSIFVNVSNIFASSLRRFLSENSELCDIPEAELPEPFNQTSTPIEAALPKTKIIHSSHLCPSFNKHFSREEDDTKCKDTQPLIPSFSCSPSKFDNLTDQETETNRTSPHPCSISDSTNAPPTVCPPSYASTMACESTPLKKDSETDGITLETPALSTPKRSFPTCESKQKPVINENCGGSILTAKRSLKFSQLEGEQNVADLIEQSQVVQDSLVGAGTKGASFEDDITASAKPSIQDDGSDSFAGDSLKMYHHGLTEFCQTSAGLSEIVPLIHKIFESVRCRWITKQELVHKIIMNGCYIDENSDVEGQIELLEKLVPDWICRKLAPSGDLLYSIKRVSDLNLVRERVADI